MSPSLARIIFPIVALAGCDPLDGDPLDADFVVIDEEAEAPQDEENDPASATLQALPPVSASSTPPDALLVAPIAAWRILRQIQLTCQVAGDGWTVLSYNDDAWTLGYSELGYGDGDEQTVIPYGPSPSNKCITQYFRHTFTIPTGEKDLYSSLVVRLLRDDGAAVYLNGIQIISSNLPNAVGPTTPASSETDSEDRFFQYSGIKNYLNDGANILAVEVHQRSKTNPDLSFNLELVGVLGQPVGARQTIRIPSVEATVDEGKPNTKLGLDSRCKVDGSTSGDFGSDQACLARWNLAQIPTGAKIRAAHLDTIVLDSTFDRFPIYPLLETSAWVENAVTWNDTNGSALGDWPGNVFGDPVYLYPPLTVVNALSTGTKLIPLPTKILTDWRTTPESNQGVAIASVEYADAIHFNADNAGLELVVTYDP